MNAKSSSVKETRNALRRGNLDQPVLSYLQWPLVFIGSCFLGMAQIQVEAFSADVFGEFALRFPAEFWALLMMCPAAMVWVGLRDPINRWMVAVGSALQVIQFMSLGYSAIYTGGEEVIGLFCTGFFSPLFAYMLVESIRRGP